MQEVFDQVTTFLKSNEKAMILNGPAGSGKTTILEAMLRTGILPRSTLYTATTNKAANVLATILKHQVTTIFSALSLVPFDNYKTGITELKQTAKPRLVAQVIIIDEAYMLVAEVIEYLEKAISSNCKIIYIGDSYQLPPVFHDISPIATMGLPTVTLTKIWRTDKPEIQDISNRFRQSVDTLKFGKLPVSAPPVEVVDHDVFIQNIITSFQTAPEDTKIVGWTNNKVIAYNNFVNKLLNQKEDFCVDDRVVVNNPITYHGDIAYSVDAEAKITSLSPHIEDMNGVRYRKIELDYDVVIHVPIDPAELSSEMYKFKARKDWKSFFELKEFFADIRHTYACTVHKSQGSTYKHVFVDASDIIKNRNIKEVAKLMYVAVSRASESVTLCMDTSDIEKEVQMLALLKVYQ